VSGCVCVCAGRRVAHVHFLYSAQRQGLLCEMEDNGEMDRDEFCEPFFAHCKAHADKDLMKRKVREGVCPHFND